jgi:hypothetical protein
LSEILRKEGVVGPRIEIGVEAPCAQWTGDLDREERAVANLDAAE